MAHVRGNFRLSVRNNLVRGTLAAAALAALLLGHSVGAQAGADVASAGVVAGESICVPQSASDLDDSIGADAAIMMAGACENACYNLWQTLLDECSEVPPSQKPQCIRDAREDYEACLDNC